MEEERVPTPPLRGVASSPAAAPYSPPSSSSLSSTHHEEMQSMLQAHLDELTRAYQYEVAKQTWWGGEKLLWICQWISSFLWTITLYFLCSLFSKPLWSQAHDMIQQLPLLHVLDALCIHFPLWNEQISTVLCVLLNCHRYLLNLSKLPMIFQSWDIHLAISALHCEWMSCRSLELS